VIGGLMGSSKRNEAYVGFVGAESGAVRDGWIALESISIFP